MIFKLFVFYAAKSKVLLGIFINNNNYKSHNKYQLCNFIHTFGS